MKRPVLVTEPTGAVGSSLVAALHREGEAIRCGTPRLEGAPLPASGTRWVLCDPADARSLRRALEGCRAAYYLDPSNDLDRAHAFARAAAREDIERIVYLGSVQPARDP